MLPLGVGGGVVGWGGRVGRVGSRCQWQQSSREERVAMGIIWKPTDGIMKWFGGSVEYIIEVTYNQR
jgi:hypothetical protein